MAVFLELFAQLSTFQLLIRMQIVLLIEHGGVLTAERSYRVGLGKQRNTG